MAIMKKLSVFLVLMAFAASLMAQDVRHRLDSVFTASPLAQTAQIGMLVWDLTADQPMFNYQAQQLLRPASTMKVLTAVAALDQLGVDYTFSTSLYYRGTVSNRTLQGDIKVSTSFWNESVFTITLSPAINLAIVS